GQNRNRHGDRTGIKRRRKSTFSRAQGPLVVHALGHVTCRSDYEWGCRSFVEPTPVLPHSLCSGACLQRQGPVGKARFSKRVDIGLKPSAKLSDDQIAHRDLQELVPREAQCLCSTSTHRSEPTLEVVSTTQVGLQ